MQGWVVGCPEDIFSARQAAETLGLVNRLTGLCPQQLDGRPLLSGVLPASVINWVTLRRLLAAMGLDGLPGWSERGEAPGEGVCPRRLWVIGENCLASVQRPQNLRCFARLAFR